MRLLLYILLLFAFNTNAQITSSVYSGARFGGVVDTGGGTYITLPGCSTQTEIITVDHIRNFNFIDGTGSGVEWRNTQFYTDSTMSPSINSVCRTIDLLDAWMVEEAKYVSIFYDLDGDGEYEYLYDNSFLLTTDSFAFQNYQANASGLTSLDTMMFRVIFHDVPLSNSCPSSVSGLVIDASYELNPDCKPLICQDTINVKPCSEDSEPYSYICITDDAYVIPIEGNIGGINITQLYEVMDGVNIELTEEDGSYFITSDYSSWIGWSIPEIEEMWFSIEVFGFSGEDLNSIGYGQIDPYTGELYIEFFDIDNYNDEWRIIIYSQNEYLDVCYPDAYGIQYPFTYLIIENPNIIIL